MLIRLFRSHQNAQLLALVLGILLLWGDAFIRLRPAETGSDLAPLYALLFSWSFSFPWLSSLLAVIMLVAQALLLNQILTDEGLAQRNSFLPAILMIMLLSYHPGLLCLHPAIPASFLLILAMRMMLKARLHEKAYQEVFSAALLLSLSALINIYYLTLLPMIWIFLIINQSYHWRDWVISILGLITPFVYLAFFYFMDDSLLQVIQSYGLVFMDLSWPQRISGMSTAEWVVQGTLTFFLLLAFVRQISRASEKVISLRRAYMMINWMLLMALISVAMNTKEWVLTGSIIMVPAVITFTNWIQSSRKTRWQELFMWLILAGIAALKILL